MWMNLENIILSEKKPLTKDHILYDSIYMKCPEQADALRQKVELWLPGVGGSANGYKASSLGDEMF